MLAVYAAGESGARRVVRGGAAAVVVVDVFRASTTIAVLVRKGARVIPVASVEEAAHVGADYRIGERDSAKLVGFDFGNSPTDVEGSELPLGATVVLTTNGTRVIEAARGAPTILAGAFVHAHAVADELATGALGARVAVIGCGWEGHRASEDESAAGAILRHLQDKGSRLDERAERVVGLYLKRSKKSLLQNSAARRLERLGYEKDLGFCLAENTVPVVPRLVMGAFVGQRWP